jgi:glycosyltransferase involved in cell wall biosynthesis
MNRPRVLVLTTYYHPVVGGVEIHARQLVQYLHTHGYGAEVVTKRLHRDPQSDALVDGVPVHRIGPAGERRASGKWVVLPALFAEIMRRAKRFDVLVCVDYRGIGVAAITAGGLLHRPVIVQGEVAGVLAGADNQSTSGLPPESLLTRCLKAPARAIYRQADRVVCIGRDLEREALRAGLPRERVEYLPHGVDLARFRPPAVGEREQLRRELGWPDKATIVLFVGRLSIEKGVMDLVEAWRQTDRRDAMLVLVGPDMPGHPWDSGGPARAYVREHGLQDSVRFEGYAPDPSRFYRAADLFVQPSHFEALGNTAIEAMASRLPVIASGVGGLADFCVDGENALLHEPRSPVSLARAITTLLGDGVLADRLAAAGRRTAEERFELTGLLDRYARLIDSVAMERR